MLQKNYKGKYFSVLGDSISTLAGYSVPEGAEYYDFSRKLSSGVLTPSDTWWGQVIEFLGGELLANNSISGSTVTWHPMYAIPSYSCSKKRTSSLDKDGVSPDVIMIYMGTNDWGAGTHIHYDERYDCDPDTPALFSVAYRRMLEKLRNNYPEAEIWCLTLPISKCSSKEGFEFPYSYGGRHINEYCEVIRSCSEEMGCRVFDLYSNEEPYDTVDGFHPNASGMKTIANALIGELKNER